MKDEFLRIMAIGDAFGMKYEFIERKDDIALKDLSFGNHPTFKEYKVGYYTDDTQMSAWGIRNTCIRS